MLKKTHPEIQVTKVGIFMVIFLSTWEKCTNELVVQKKITTKMASVVAPEA